MNFIKATAYKGYTNVSKETSIKQFVELIRYSPQGSRMIDKIDTYLQNNEIDKANNVKKQLPFFTLTSNYEHTRRDYSIKCYNQTPILDFDDLEKEKIAFIRELIENDPNTVLCFLSPRRSGLKVLVYMDTPKADNLRRGLLEGRTVDFAMLEKFHATMYEMARKHFEKLTGEKVDTSGKDLGRGVYLSQDEEVYFNEALLEKIVPITNIVNKPDKNAKKKRGTKLSVDLAELDGVNVEERFKRLFIKALDSTRKKFTFEEGSRNSFLNQLGVTCYRKYIPFEQALVMAVEKYGNSGEDIATPLQNGYQYSSKADEADDKKRPLIEKVTDFLNDAYEFRFNEVAEKVEYKSKVICYGNEKVIEHFQTMEDRDINSVFVEMQKSGIKGSKNYLKAVIQSDFSPSYNPFVEYFTTLPPWDGNDYIAELADMVTTTNRDFWHKSLTKWLVGMVACATVDKIVNQHALMLYSRGQGIGKSTWVRNLLPPQLEEYQRSGMLNINNKDHSMLLSTLLLINLDEFDGVKRSELADLKRIITQACVNERKAYAADTKMMVRRASFIASTNNQKCLQDMEGNRRFLLSTVESVDLSQKVNHAGVYAQAFYLLMNGFQYWFEGDEIQDINLRNENYRMKEPAEELFYVHFRQATAADYMAKWYPAAQIMAYLGSVSRINQDVYTQNTIVKVLERDGFCKRLGTSGLTEYQVIRLSFEEVESEAKFKSAA